MPEMAVHRDAHKFVSPLHRHLTAAMARINAAMFMLRRTLFDPVNSTPVCRQRTTRSLRLSFVVALATLPLACAGANQSGSAPGVTGNEQGGRVPYTEGGVQAAGDAARAHCSQFGKKAQITQMQPADAGGGTIGFQCR